MRATSRRHFLTTALGLTVTAAIPPSARANTRARWLTTHANAISSGGAAEPRFGFTALADDGAIVFETPLPGRAHGVAVSPDGRTAVVMARRPGRWFSIIDLVHETAGPTIPLPANRRGTGHGVFDHDGARLFMALDDIDTDTGALAILDPTAGYRITAEWPAHGVGPHEVILINGGRALAVANGGVVTHPDTGRAKLNIDTMAPSLTVLSALDGHLIDKAEPEAGMDNLGIRHIAETADGRIIHGAQDERPTGEVQPLVGFLRPGAGRLEPLAASDAVWRSLRGYVGSVATHGDAIAAASPRGGVVAIWRDGTPPTTITTPLADGCGLAAADGAGRFLASNGLGSLITTDVTKNADMNANMNANMNASQPLAHFPNRRWDNHIVGFTTG